VWHNAILARKAAGGKKGNRTEKIPPYFPTGTQNNNLPWRAKRSRRETWITACEAQEMWAGLACHRAPTHETLAQDAAAHENSNMA